MNLSVEYLWIPNLFFFNERKPPHISSFHRLTISSCWALQLRSMTTLYPPPPATKQRREFFGSRFGTLLNRLSAMRFSFFFHLSVMFTLTITLQILTAARLSPSSALFCSLCAALLPLLLRRVGGSRGATSYYHWNTALSGCERSSWCLWPLYQK